MQSKCRLCWENSLFSHHGKRWQMMRVKIRLTDSHLLTFPLRHRQWKDLRITSKMRSQIWNLHASDSSGFSECQDRETSARSFRGTGFAFRTLVFLLGYVSRLSGLLNFYQVQLIQMFTRTGSSWISPATCPDKLEWKKLPTDGVSSVCSTMGSKNMRPLFRLPKFMGLSLTVDASVIKSISSVFMIKGGNIAFLGQEANFNWALWRREEARVTNFKEVVCPRSLFFTSLHQYRISHYLVLSDYK